MSLDEPRILQEAAAPAPAKKPEMSDTAKNKAIAILARKSGESLRIGKSSTTNALIMACGYAL